MYVFTKLKQLYIKCSQCNKMMEVTTLDVQDTTPCSCGRCSGEEYEVMIKEDCEHCGAEIELKFISF